MPKRQPPAFAVSALDTHAEAAVWKGRFQNFLSAQPLKTEFVVLCHSDADGLAAGAILVRRLQRTGRQVRALCTGKGGNAWDAETARRLLALEPDCGALIVCDLGVRAEPIRAVGSAPMFFIDHHRPSGLPPDADALVISGYGLDPTPTSGLLALWCSEGLPPETPSEKEADPSEDWIAAISVLSDLGDRAPFPQLAAWKKHYGAGVLREVTTLLNAPRRAAGGDATPALRALIRARGPRDLLDAANDPDAAALVRAREEVNAAYAEAKKAAPHFSRDRKVPLAMIRIHTPCQVHPLIAQIWRTRLPKLMVLGVNTGYNPGFVHFSGRCGTPHNLLDFLRAHRPAGADPNLYGNGHDHAAGGALPTEVWNQFVRDLGFGHELLVGEAKGNTATSRETAAQMTLSL